MGRQGRGGGGGGDDPMDTGTHRHPDQEHPACLLAQPACLPAQPSLSARPARPEVASLPWRARRLYGAGGLARYGALWCGWTVDDTGLWCVDEQYMYDTDTPSASCISMSGVTFPGPVWVGPSCRSDRARGAVIPLRPWIEHISSEMTSLSQSLKDGMNS